jgi:hypothetical protein
MKSLSILFFFAMFHVKLISGFNLAPVSLLGRKFTGSRVLDAAKKSVSALTEADLKGKR